MHTSRWAAVAALTASAGMAMAARSWLRTAELRRQLDAARDAATHDPLTGLLNRDGLAQAWPMLAPARPVVALIDLDGFKQVNDRHGHAAGDVLLTVVAGRLADVVHGVVARLGGDEFVTVLSTPTALPWIADAVAAPVTLPGGATVQVTASIGASSSDNGDLGAALTRADAAMYRAKATGTGVAMYDPRRDDHASPESDRLGARVRDLTALAGGVR